MFSHCYQVNPDLVREVVSSDRLNYIKFWTLGMIKSGLYSKVVFIHSGLYSKLIYIVFLKMGV